jgi:hypothetical protein
MATVLALYCQVAILTEAEPPRKLANWGTGPKTLASE